MELVISLFALLMLAPSVFGSSPQLLMDLSHASWGDGQVFHLDGEWQFVADHWVPPEDWVESNASKLPVTRMTVPGFWNEMQPSRSAQGIGTLAARVGVPRDRPLFLQLSDVASAYRLYVNGSLVAQVGQPAVQPHAEAPMFQPVVVELPRELLNGELHLVLHISNHQYKQIGVRRSIQLTDESGFQDLREKPLLFDVFFCGILLSLGIFYFGRYLRRSNDRASLYFGLFSLMVGSRALLVGERLLYQWDALSWTVLQKAEHMLLYLGLAAFAAYLYELLDGGMSRRFLNLLWGSSALLVLAVGVLPISIGTLTVVPFKWLVLACSVFVAVTYWPLLKARGAGVFWFLVSFVILLAALLIDLVFPTWQWMARPIVHWGMIGFVLAQASFLNHVRLWRQKRLREEGLREEGSRDCHEALSPSNEAPGQIPGATNSSHQRMEELERQVALLRQDLARVHLLPPVTPSLSTGESGEATKATSEQGTASSPPSGNCENRRRLVELLCHALTLWERHTGSGKVQLAEQSRCWRVYVDGSTVKTRTFDKYLKLQTLPGRPRWRLVTRTAYFVSQLDNLPEADAVALRKQTAEVERCFNGTNKRSR